MLHNVHNVSISHSLQGRSDASAELRLCLALAISAFGILVTFNGQVFELGLS